MAIIGLAVSAILMRFWVRAKPPGVVFSDVTSNKGEPGEGGRADITPSTLADMEVAEAIKAAIHEYEMRLKDLRDDETRGLMSVDEREVAHAEIARRLLAEKKRLTLIAQSIPEESEGAGHSSEKNLRLFRFGGAAALLLMPVIAGLIYWQTGSPGMRDFPLATRGDVTTPTRASQEVSNELELAALIGKVEADLIANPDTIIGWKFLGRSYEGQGRIKDAVRAWEKVLSLDEDDRDALWFLGSIAREQTRLDDARFYWQKLQDQFDPQSEEFKLIEDALKGIAP